MEAGVAEEVEHGGQPGVEGQQHRLHDGRLQRMVTVGSEDEEVKRCAPEAVQGGFRRLPGAEVQQPARLPMSLGARDEQVGGDLEECRRPHLKVTCRGALKAVVAVEHATLVAIWHMINGQVPYRHPGTDYYTRLNPDKIKNQAIDQLTAIGYTVTLTPRPLTGPQRQ